MKYFFTFTFIASLSLYYGFNSKEYFWITCWVSLSFYYVGLCYFGMIPGFFKKNGKIPIVIKLINAPYFILTLVTWHVYKKCMKENSTDDINDSLCIGRRQLPGEFNLEKIDYYLDLTSEFDEPQSYRNSEKYLNFPILDADVPDYKSLNELISKIKGSKVFIHCAQGHGRTGLVAILFLIANNSVDSVEEGLNLLKSKRPKLDVNSEQLRFLNKYLGE